jgi:hypothetical protein
MEVRDVPIIRDASLYDFSIVRFTASCGKDLPLFIPRIRIGPIDNPNQDINLTIYSVSLTLDVSYVVSGTTYTGSFTSTQPVMYQTETDDITKGQPPVSATTWTSQNIDSRYYWVYTYSHWLDIMNATFAKCFTQTTQILNGAGVPYQTYGLQKQFEDWWVAQSIPGTAPDLTTKAPYLTWNPTNNLFTLYADTYGFGGDDRTSAGSAKDENVKLFFNANTMGLFTNFNNVYRNLPNGLTNEIKVYSILNQNTYQAKSLTGVTGTLYWVMVQDYPSVGTLWSPISSLVFISNMLPLLNEQTGEPVLFGESNTGDVNGRSQAAFTPIVTDISLPTDYAHAYREQITYNPTAEYRMVSFQCSKQPINAIDIQVYWKCTYDGQLRPVQLFNGSSIELKILFRRHE